MKCEVCNGKVSYHESYEVIGGKKVHAKCIIDRIIGVPDEDLPMKPEGSA